MATYFDIVNLSLPICVVATTFRVIIVVFILNITYFVEKKDFRRTKDIVKVLEEDLNRRLETFSNAKNIDTLSRIKDLLFSGDLFLFMESMNMEDRVKLLGPMEVEYKALIGILHDFATARPKGNPEEDTKTQEQLSNTIKMIDDLYDNIPTVETIGTRILSSGELIFKEQIN